MAVGTTAFATHFLEGTHAARPAYDAVPAGTKYACTDHDIIYESDGTTAWSDWYAPSFGTDLTAHAADADAHHTYPHALDDNSDVNAPAPSDLDVLTWNDYAGEWQAYAAQGGASALDDLTDVDAPTPSDLDVLTWNDYTGAWEAYPAQGGASALDDLTDVNVPTPSDLDVLTYNDYTGEWEAYPAQGGASALTDLTDVDTDKSKTPEDGDVLTFDGTDWNAERIASLYSDEEMDYTEATSPVTVTATTEGGADTVVTASAITFDGDTEVIIDFWAPYARPDAAGGLIRFALYDGASSIGLLNLEGDPAGVSYGGVRGSRRLTPSAASHTYSIRAYVDTGSGQVGAGAGGSGNYMPMFVRISRARGPLLSAGPDTTILGTILDAPAASDQLDVIVPFDCTVVGSLILGDVSGSAVVDVWVDDPANAPPTDADSITASAPPTLSSAIYAQDTTLTGWTTALTAGQVVRFNVDSASTVGRLFVGLQVRRTVPTGGLQEGTAFPANPTTNQRYRRTDLDGRVFRYDGTRWLSEEAIVIQGPSVENITATTGYTYLPLADPIAGAEEVYIERVWGNLYQGSAGSGTDYWSFDSNVTELVDTQSVVGSVYELVAASPKSMFTITNPRCRWTKHGSPGSLYGSVAILIRLVAT